MQLPSVLVAVLAPLALAAPGHRDRRGVEGLAVHPRDPSYPVMTMPQSGGYPANPYPANPPPENPYPVNPRPPQNPQGEAYPVTSIRTTAYPTTRTTTKASPTTRTTTTAAPTPSSLKLYSTTTIKPYSTTTIKPYPTTTIKPYSTTTIKPYSTTTKASSPRPTTTKQQSPPQSSAGVPPPKPPTDGGKGKNKACGASQPMCCETSLMGLASVSCKPASGGKKQSAKNLQKECANTGYTAKCCAGTLLTLPVGLICSDPPKGSK